MTDLPARRAPRPPVWVAGLTVVLGIVLAGGAWASGLIGTPSPSRQATGLTPPGSSSVVPSSPSAPALGNWTHVGWQDVSSAFGGANVSINAGTAWRGGFVLVGAQEKALLTGVYGVIWSSSDGVTWQRVPDPSVHAFSGPLVAVAATGDTLVAVGQAATATAGPDQAAAWVSHDGVTWVPGPGAFSALDGLQVAGIAAGPDGFVVYGQAQGPVGQPSHAALLYSPDGVHWAAETMPGDGPRAEVMSVVATPDGFAAVGLAPGGTNGSAGAWWSTDGQTWHSSVAPPVYGLSSLTQRPAGALQAYGFNAPCSVCLGPLGGGTTWSSADDGRTWQKAGDAPVMWDGDTILFDDGRLVRLETEAGAWGLWSTDGVTWEPLRMDGETLTISRLLIAYGPTLIAADDLIGGAKSVFFGRLDDQAGPTPSPTLVPGSHDALCPNDKPCGP